MAGEALVDLSQCAPWQVRERYHSDMAGGDQGGMVESHSHHADTTPSKVLLGGREKGRVGKWVGTERRRERKNGRRERGGVHYLMAEKRKGESEKGEKLSLKEDFM